MSDTNVVENQLPVANHELNGRITLLEDTFQVVDSPRERRAEVVQRRGETVLVVEDEPALLTMDKMILEHLGYRVLTAGTPGEALGLVQKHENEIHLLLTDVVMPEMNGRDLAERVQSISPSIKVLFMSGHPVDVIAPRAELGEVVNFIQKPFSMQDMAAKVRGALREN